MKVWLKILACLLLYSVGSAIAAPPNRISASYDIYKGSMKVGRIEENFVRDNNRYTLTSNTKAVGWLAIFAPGEIAISSSGLVNEHGLKPLRYSDLREHSDSKNRHAKLDWNIKQIDLIHSGQRTTVALPEGTQDRLSAMYQFMFLSLKSGTTLRFPMTNGHKLDNYHYTISPGEKLSTPAGQFDTLYLDSKAKNGENRTEIWLATQQYNLPCKMTITESNGDQLTQILSTLSVLQ